MCSPNDVSVDAAATLALDEQMDEIVDRWTEHIRDTLRELVVQAKVVSKRSKGVDPLNLAIITFGFAKSPYDSKRCAFSSSASKLYMRASLATQILERPCLRTKKSYTRRVVPCITMSLAGGFTFPSRPASFERLLRWPG